jgi:AcrR family transcriptional regulator
MVASPQVTTFMLRAVPAAGPAFTSRLRNSAMRIGVALEFCLRSGDGPLLPPPLLEGVVAGLARVGRVRVPAAQGDEFREVAADAAEWISSLCLPRAASVEPALASVPPGSKVCGSPPRQHHAGDWEGAPGNERTMILVAAFRIARSRGYHQLSIPAICREAGIPRRSFNRHFEDLEDCFCSALEERVADAVEGAVSGSSSSMSWSAAVYETLRMLCAAIDGDPGTARVLLVEVSAAGAKGVDSHDRQISQVARALRATASLDQRASELAGEASTAAAWAILRQRASEQRSASVGSLLPHLAYLFLAPVIGATAALGMIRADCRQSSRIKKRNV